MSFVQAAQCDPNFREDSIFYEINLEACQQHILTKRKPTVDSGIKIVEQNTRGPLKAKMIEKLFLVKTRNSGRQQSRRPELDYVFPLATPQGQMLLCEMCSLPGRLRCSSCRVAYYCSMAHYKADESHPAVCHKLGAIRTKMDYSGTSVVRGQRWAEKLLVMTCLLEEEFCNAIEQLYQSKLTSALVNFQICLIYMPQTWGLVSFEGITLLAFMSETFTRQKKTIMAAHALSVAVLSMRELEKLETSPILYTKALLFRSQGLLDLAEERYHDALLNFAECIYYTTEIFGPYHIRTCGGYYFLGMTFVSRNDRSNGFSILDFVLDIWMKHLRDLYFEYSDGQGETILHHQKEAPLSRFLHYEAVMQLNGMDNVYSMEEKSAPIKLNLCRGILSFFAGNYDIAVKEINYVLEVLKSPEYSNMYDIELLAKKIIHQLERNLLRSSISR